MGSGLQKSTSNRFKKSFDSLVSKSNQIVITSHERPDHDAVTSCLAVLAYIQTNFPGKQVGVYITAKPNNAFQNLPGVKSINWVQSFWEHTQEADLIIFLDAWDYNRFGSFAQKPALACATICIDHHPDCDQDYDLKHIDPTAISTAQLLYEQLWQYVQKQEDRNFVEVGRLLLTGIMADSGSFRFVGPEKSRVLSTVEQIIQSTGLDLKPIVTEIAQVDANQFKVLQVFVANMQLVDLSNSIPPLFYSYLSPQSVQQLNPEEVKVTKNNFLFEYTAKVAGYNWGFTVYQLKPGVWELSFRSGPGGPDVNLLAKHFNGGGHKYAAGGQVESEAVEPQEVINQVLTIIKAQKPQAT